MNVNLNGISTTFVIYNTKYGSVRDKIDGDIDIMHMDK